MVRAVVVPASRERVPVRRAPVPPAGPAVLDLGHGDDTGAGAATPARDQGSDQDGGTPAGDAGMSTVEYAVGTIVAAAFAAVLYKIVTGDSVVSGLTSLINSALHTSL
ncbi:hypothetical protein GCM10011594_26950 [Nakamurella endophytica]|uniref:DUF4244 domain-containing protein n=1 Tax=Nakamurella endophytica TaxID=1748367 RepID=A0A917T168_9ACTN|nr:hypothetical protein GCM10011594_26950 [Nakamurella endophytica]